MVSKKPVIKLVALFCLGFGAGYLTAHVRDLSLLSNRIIAGDEAYIGVWADALRLQAGVLHGLPAKPKAGDLAYRLYLILPGEAAILQSRLELGMVSNENKAKIQKALAAWKTAEQELKQLMDADGVDYKMEGIPLPGRSTLGPMPAEEHHYPGYPASLPNTPGSPAK